MSTHSCAVCVTIFTSIIQTFKFMELYALTLAPHSYALLAERKSLRTRLEMFITQSFILLPHPRHRQKLHYLWLCTSPSLNQLPMYVPTLTGKPWGSFRLTNSLSLLKCLYGAMTSRMSNNLHNITQLTWIAGHLMVMWSSHDSHVTTLTFSFQ